MCLYEICQSLYLIGEFNLFTFKVITDKGRDCCHIVASVISVFITLFLSSVVFLLLNEFYYIYSCTTILTTQLYSISIQNTQCIPPTLQPVSFGNQKFFKICELVSVLQRSSLCPFFRFHMKVVAYDISVLLSYQLHLA